ncbi:hypothetical protein C0V75_17985 [Tabrizicola sp. TH137]|uniref:hypothetical protein n=1 Tax=Tabrizicola sp. TH137 TaxID=2067452 RepID=UPI000C7CE45D|nr:hypothetical protein [Tabrizicola sp. TH137]PLL11170.1 hypothetical protein C0V75_17985 [Tabrizicola sp. TH137]
MGRSGHLSGATVALELLPRDIEPAEGDGPVAVIDGDDPERQGEHETALHLISGLALRAGRSVVPLAGIAALADVPQPPFQAMEDAGVDAGSGNLPEALGRMIATMVARKGADRRLLYRIGLALATLGRSAEAYAILCLMDGPTVQHPAILALKGYLALQNGEVDIGRRSLAKAALTSRGMVSNRSILHFTQHVLLVHQFNG